jgi:hypothetical protein
VSGGAPSPVGAALDAFFGTGDRCDWPDTSEDHIGPTDWRSLRAIVLHRDHYQCAECGRKATEVDHIWPKSAGGRDVLSNLRALCRNCNATKGDTILLRHITAARLRDASHHELTMAARSLRQYVRWFAMETLVREYMAEHTDVPTIDDMSDINAVAGVRARDDERCALAIAHLARVLGLPVDLPAPVVAALLGRATDPETTEVQS